MLCYNHICITAKGGFIHARPAERKNRYYHRRQQRDRAGNRRPVRLGRSKRRHRRKERRTASACEGSEYIVGEVDAPDNPEELLRTALDRFGGLDILVCCAGTALRDKSLDMSIEDWERVMRVNLTAPMELSRVCIRHFIKQDHGKIVYVSSNAGRHVNMGASPSYGASKAGLLYLTRHFATEFSKNHIYVNAVLPGPVETELSKTWTPEHRAEVMANLPVGRLGQPEDIANSILFLASSMSDYITGACVSANGGRNMD